MYSADILESIIAMEQLVLNNIISIGQSLGSEWLSAVLLIILYAIILLLWRFCGKEGLYMYNVIAVIVANIQVLKITSISFSPEPIALGTLLFATTFLVSDILTEHCGTKTAKTGVMLSFLAQIIVTIIMLITLAYPSLGGVTGKDSDKLLIDGVQVAMYTLFAPSLRILIASLTSYYICQQVDILIFKALKDLSNKKMLWLRLNVATLISGLLDNILFSTLAWVILSPNPVGFNTLIFTYILGTYAARVLVSITSTPIIYLSYKLRTH